MPQQIGFFDQLRQQVINDAPKEVAEQPATEPTEQVQVADRVEPLAAGSVESSIESVPELAGDIPAEPAIDAIVPPTEETGRLPPDAKRALVSLLRYGVILATQKSKLFVAICRYKTEISSHLADMYLKLVLDEQTGVAFVSQRSIHDQPEDDQDEPVTLITRRTLTLFDTLVLLVLRKHYQERETAGEQKVVIDVERIAANLTPFMPLTNSTKADRKQLNATLQRMVEKRILSKISGSDDRFTITPIIRYVVDEAFLQTLLTEYQRLGAAAGAEMSVTDIESEAT